jgi:ABC-type branched-subunit amino acid transport system permease subunit
LAYHLSSILSSTTCLVSVSLLFRASSVLLTYYAVFIARSGGEGNFIGSVLGVVPFTLIGTAVFISSSLYAVKFFPGRVKLEVLSVICVIAAIDFANDLVAVFWRVQLLPV